MRRFIGYSAIAMIGFGVMTACAVSTEPTETSASTTSATTVADVAAQGELSTIDLSRPDQAIRIDTSKGSVDLSRVKVIGVKGNSIVLSELVGAAEKSSGVTTPKEGFVLRSPAEKMAFPGDPGKCSFTTSTDCCECGWWPDGMGRCAGFWCPYFPNPF